SCRGSAHCAEAALCSSDDCCPVTIWGRLTYWGNSTGPIPMLISRLPVAGDTDSAREKDVRTYSRVGGPVLQPFMTGVLTARVARRTKSRERRWLIWSHSPGGQRPAHSDGAPDSLPAPARSVPSRKTLAVFSPVRNLPEHWA